MQALGLALLGLLAHSVSARFISDNICLAMPNGQKLPITDDCGSYIVCEYNVQKIQHCTVGTLFDPMAMVCNWAAFVKCGQTPSLPPILVAPSTMSPVTIPTAPTPPRVPSPVPVVPTAPTPPPTPAATTTTTTKKPYQPPVIPTAPTAPPTMGASTTPPFTGTIRPTTTLRPVQPTTPQSNIPLNPYPFCTPDEFSFTAHPSACESYYICAYGKLILHSCGHGVYWNTATNQCDFPENTDCTNLPNPAAPETSTPSGETTTTPSSIPDCYGSDIFYPNFGDCSKYYICIGLHPILMSCPTNYLWNSKVAQCELPGTAVCAKK